LRNVAGDETSAVSSTLYQDAGIRHSCHNSVAAHEVDLIRIRTGKKLGEQTALFYHLCCRFPVLTGVEVVEAVSQNAHGFIAVGERLSMSHDIHTISQAAHYQDTRRQLLQIRNEAADKVFAVRSAVAGSHDVDDSLLVEVGVAFIEEHERRIIAILESLRITFIVHRYRFDTISYVVFQFFFGAFSGLVAVLDSVHEFIRGIGQDVSEVVLMLQDERGGAHLSV